MLKKFYRSSCGKAASLLIALQVLLPAALHAQNTMKVWKMRGDTTCGERRQGSTTRRFIAIDYGDRVTYDYAPTEGRWQNYCVEDPTAPKPTLEEAIAEFGKPLPTPSCSELNSTWRQLTAADRAFVRKMRAKTPVNDACPVPP